MQLSDSRFFGRDYRPSQLRDVARRVDVGVVNIPATYAGEYFSIALSASAAAGASLAGVTRVNRHNGNASQSSLVADKLAKLREGPGIVQPALLAPEPLVSPVSDAGQILQGDACAGNPGFGHDGFADVVVDRPCESRLTTLEPAKATARIAARGSFAFGCFRLQRAANLCALQPLSRHFRSAKSCAIGEGGDVRQSEVNAQRCAGRLEGNIPVINLDADVIMAFPLGQNGGCWRLARQRVTLVLTDGQGEFVTPIQQREAHHPISFNKPENARVIINAGGAEDAIAPFGFCQRGRYAGNCAHGQIGCQSKLGANVTIGSGMEFELSRHLVLSSPIRREVAAIGKRLKRRLQGRHRIRRNIQFANYRSHAEKIVTNRNMSTPKKKGERRFLSGSSLSFHAVV